MGMELDGVDAFDKVLDKLLDATAKIAREDGWLQEARKSATDSLSRSSTLRKQLDDMTVLSARADTVAVALIKASEALLAKLADQLGDAGMIAPPMPEERGTLKKAIAVAKEVFDEIPF